MKSNGVVILWLVGKEPTKKGGLFQGQKIFCSCHGLTRKQVEEYAKRIGEYGKPADIRELPALTSIID